MFVLDLLTDVVFVFYVLSCCIIVTWRGGLGEMANCFLSVLLHCWLAHQTGESIVSEVTDNVLSGLNFTQ